MKKENFIEKVNEALFLFNAGYGDSLFNDFKKSAPELTANYCIPVTAVLLVQTEKGKLCKYGKQILTLANGDLLDKFCKKHNTDRFILISKEKYKEIVIDLILEILKQIK
jgi:hypothetical protein